MKPSLQNWTALVQGLEGQDESGLEAWHQKLVQAYAEPQRHYHDGTHLEECLAFFQEALAQGHLRQPRELDLALWFHDAVYDPQAADNEERSAQLAREFLGSSPCAEGVSRLILSTRDHRLADHPDAAWMVDIDLGIFGQGQARFQAYEADIRREYAWVPRPLYREKRLEILQRFLDRQPIYQTAYFRGLWEDQARRNLSGLLARLGQGIEAG